MKCLLLVIILLKSNTEVKIVGSSSKWPIKNMMLTLNIKIFSFHPDWRMMKIILTKTSGFMNNSLRRRRLKSKRITRSQQMNPHILRQTLCVLSFMIAISRITESPKVHFRSLFRTRRALAPGSTSNQHRTCQRR